MGKMRMTTNPKDYTTTEPHKPGSELNQGVKKTPFYKKKWFIASAAAVVLIGAVAGCGEDGASAVSPSSTPSSDSSVAVQSEADTGPSSSSGSSSEADITADSREADEPINTIENDIDEPPEEEKPKEETPEEKRSEESSAPEAISDAASESESVAPLPDEPSSAPVPTQNPEPSEPEQNPVSPPKSSGGAGNSNNFDTYDNKEQQNTSASYVLNTNTMKFHYPSCSSVAKIAPQNYEEFYGTRDEVIAMGYKSCGRCHP